MKSKFHALCASRKEKFEALIGANGLADWQSERLAFFLKQIGDFPERTPLNGNVVGKLDGDGYRIEKIVFESRPNFHVTATLYLPLSDGPYPAILIPCGHSHSGKASGQYQKAAILFAQNGMAALCYDPVGQGERYQILATETNQHFQDIPRKMKVPHPRVQHLCTSEHTMMAVGSILLGENFAQYRIWDGMRAIDYLQSRPDIISDKIGCTGNSGGGTLTSYLMALDDRIIAAAPGCYLTTFSRLIETKGPQDGEQNIFGQISFGMGAADYAIIRAPSPVMICASTRDATFDITGAREVFTQANRFYSKLGYPGNIRLNEADVPHGYYIQHREAVARFMSHHLLGSDREIWEKPRSEWPNPVTDEFLRSLSEAVWTPHELYASPNGQVALMKNERTVFDINRDKLNALKQQRKTRWTNHTPRAKQAQIRKTLGAIGQQVPRFKEVGQSEYKGYMMKKIIMHRDGKIPLPALAFVPKGKITGQVLLLNGKSKNSTETAVALTNSGKLVLSAELSGIGETASGEDKKSWGYGRFGHDNQEIFTAYMMGDSFVRIRTEDIFAFTKFFNGNACELIAVNEAAIPALHAAAIDPESFSSTTVRNMIRSWADVVETPEHWNQLVNSVHGALPYYDLPDLVEMTGAKVIDSVGVNWK